MSKENCFLNTLGHIAGGALIQQLNNQLTELVSNVDDYGKPGKLIVEIGIKKATRGGAMHIIGKSILKKSPDEPMETLLFATPEGDLISDDPGQQRLDLKVVQDDERFNQKLKSI